MLAQKRISQKQLIIYLSIVGVIIIVIVLLLFRKSIFGPGVSAPGGGESEADSGIAAIIKTRFDITKLKIFDVQFFADPRLKNLFEPTLGERAKPVVGKRNPFEPQNASSTSGKK
jgi:hypothetical protein